MSIHELHRSKAEKKQLTDFTENNGFLVLSGPNGSGKTVSAMAIYQCFTPYYLPAFDHNKAIFVTQADMNAKWLESFETSSTTQLAKSYSDTELLVIDDVGTRTPSEAFLDFLYCVIDSRWKDRLTHATIITTNLSSADLNKQFGGAFFSRISSGICMKIVDKDRRMKEEVSPEQQDQNKLYGRWKNMQKDIPWHISFLGSSVYLVIYDGDRKRFAPLGTYFSDSAKNYLEYLDKHKLHFQQMNDKYAVEINMEYESVPEIDEKGSSKPVSRFKQALGTFIPKTKDRPL